MCGLTPEMPLSPSDGAGGGEGGATGSAAPALNGHLGQLGLPPAASFGEWLSLTNAGTVPSLVAIVGAGGVGAVGAPPAAAGAAAGATAAGQPPCHFALVICAVGRPVFDTHAWPPETHSPPGQQSSAPGAHTKPSVMDAGRTPTTIGAGATAGASGASGPSGDGPPDGACVGVGSGVQPPASVKMPVHGSAGTGGIAAGAVPATRAALLSFAAGASGVAAAVDSTRLMMASSASAASMSPVISAVSDACAPRSLRAYVRDAKGEEEREREGGACM